ncbi:MAG: radical SAM protein [Desulfovibrionaceae bacterium]
MKKNKVILVYPDSGEKYNHDVPLSLVWIAAPLYEAGYEVVIYDQRLDGDYRAFLKPHVADAICMGVTSFSGFQLKGGMAISSWMKEKYPDVPVVWGGWHVSILTEQSMREPFIDYIVHGQGEIPFLALVRHLQAGTDPRGIENLAYRDEQGKVVVNERRKLIDINTLPKKPYHLLDVKRYTGRRLTENDVYLVWMSSVGCPFNCAFCADPLVYKRRWLGLDPIRMADEIEELVERFGITQFGFWDDNFFIDFKRVEIFVDELIRRKINVKWNGTIRISGIVRIPMELLKKCHAAGLHMVHPGVEGATQPMLDFMNKKEKASNTLIAARKLADVGIKSLYSFIVGLPDEPESNVQDTFDMVEQLKRINPDNIIPVNFYTPYPGNHLYDYSIKKGFVPPANMKEWSDFSTRLGITPWLTAEYRNKVWMRDKYYYPAAYPSSTMQEKMRHGAVGYVYRLLHRLAKKRVAAKDFDNPWDWRLLYRYWRFWAATRKYLKFLPNINFRW